MATQKVDVGCVFFPPPPPAPRHCPEQSERSVFMHPQPEEQFGIFFSNPLGEVEPDL